MAPSLCQVFRDRLELGRDTVLSRELQQHRDGCAACREYGELARWSQQVIRAGTIEVTPPLMSAVWASIHRASEQAWDSALTRSFRYLLPYMVAVVALIFLVGGLTTTNTTTPAQAASTAYSVLNAPEVPSVAGMMTASDLPSEGGDLLGGARP